MCAFVPLTSPLSRVGRRSPCTAGTTVCRMCTLPCCNGCRDLQNYHTENGMSSMHYFSAVPSLCPYTQHRLLASSVGGSAACQGLYCSRTHSHSQHGRHAWTPLALERGFSLHATNRKKTRETTKIIIWATVALEGKEVHNEVWDVTVSVLPARQSATERALC